MTFLALQTAATPEARKAIWDAVQAAKLKSTDQEREERIEALMAVILDDKTTNEQAHEACAELSREHAARSPAQVAKMEQEQGLR